MMTHMSHCRSHVTTLQNDTKDRFQPIESLLFKKQHQTVGRNANQLRRNVPSATLQDHQNAARRNVTKPRQFDIDVYYAAEWNDCYYTVN